MSADAAGQSGSHPPRRIAVIGGGITGLAAAHRLVELARAARCDVQLTLLEASDRLGGIIATARRDGFIMEAGPDAFITSKPAGLDLCERLGLSDQLIQTNEQHRRTLIVHDGRLIPVPDGFQLLAPTRWGPFLRSPLLSWPGKLRVALDLVLPRGRTHGDESLASFVRRRFGQEALERIAQPLVGGIYTADPEQLSLAATLPRFLELEREQRSIIRGLRREQRLTDSPHAAGARYGLFVSFREGMETLIEGLTQRLPPGSVHLHWTVRTIARDVAGGFRCDVESGESVTSEALIVAAPAHAAAPLLSGVDAKLSGELAAIVFASAATINLIYDRDVVGHPLDAFGFVVPAAERLTTIACTFSSVKFAGRAPAGQALLRAFVGGALNPEPLTLDDESLVAAVRADLHKLLRISNAPRRAVVVRWPQSMPQYPVGHLDRVARVMSLAGQHPGLFLAGNSYRGVGIPDCIASGEAAAEAAWRHADP